MERCLEAQLANGNTQILAEGLCVGWQIAEERGIDGDTFRLWVEHYANAYRLGTDKVP